MFNHRVLSVFAVLCLVMTDLVADPAKEQSVAVQAVKVQAFESSDHPAALLELYTSQGCSSCPPAERWFSNLVQDKRLWKVFFPLAFHVDYWDYIGWKDSFADPKFSVRQRLYERLGYTRNVATPGFIYAGKGWHGWFRGQRLPALEQSLSVGKLKATVNGNVLQVNYSSDDAHDVTNLPGLGSVKLNIAILGFDMMVNITAGENNGKKVKQDFVVLSHLDVFMNENKNDWSLQTLLPDHSLLIDKQALVIWVAQGRDPSPLQVTGGWL